ncbi:MAG: hypothetical protein O2865_13655 [Planctomycetota bacterium]|nr:hypothetical protein [Planctomycetota bacterium]
MRRVFGQPWAGHLALSLLSLALPLAAQNEAQVRPVQGTLTERDGVMVLEVRGTLEERGFAEGYLTGDRIVSLFRGFALSRLPIPGAWNLMVLPKLRSALELPDWVRPWCDAVVAGIAARDEDLLEIPELGRDLHADDLIGVAALPDLLGLACSSFVAWGGEVEGDGPVVGRNLDYFANDELLRNTMVVVHAPRGERAGWVSIGWPGMAGCLTGFSDRGVSAAIHDVPSRAVPGKKVTPRTIALQELIETLSPDAEAAERGAATLRGFRYPMGGNFMVGWKAGADAGPGGAVFEVAPSQEMADGVTVRAADDGQTFVVCSNDHVARVGRQPRCSRFGALRDGFAEVEAALDFGACRELIRESEVRMTLYQSVVDLGTGDLAFRLRRARSGDVWTEVEGWNFHRLLRTGAASGTEPVTTGAGR